MEGGGDRAEPISLPTSRKGMGGEDKGTPGRTKKGTKDRGYKRKGPPAVGQY